MSTTVQLLVHAVQRRRRRLREHIKQRRDRGDHGSIASIPTLCDIDNLDTNPRIQLERLKMAQLHVNHKVHRYPIIPRVLYLQRWGRRFSLSFGRKGRVSYG